MFKKVFLSILVLMSFSSCISTKVFNDLVADYDELKKERNELGDKNQELASTKNKLENDLAALQLAYDKAVSELSGLKQDYEATNNNLKNLRESYNALERNSSSALADNAKKNRKLLSQLEAKERALTSESARLEELRRELNARSKKVNELESVIAAKDAAMKQLKEAISKALLDFEGKGLTVEQRNGKVYVSMENKLLFESGSWAVGNEGRRAVQQLGNVLGQNPEIAVLIEGHTDNVPYKGNESLSGNWDLSTKRATAIVNILLENNQIKANNITAAGRGEYAPIATNETVNGKAKNRRIEVVLTPKLDKVTKLLNGI